MAKHKPDEEQLSVPMIQHSEADLVAMNEDYQEDLDVDQSDFTIPNLRLLQGSSETVKAGMPGARPGVFWDPYSESAVEMPCQLTVFYFTKRRFCRGGDVVIRDGAEEQVERCHSFDCVQGTHYGDCETCALKEWASRGGRRQAPYCTLEYLFYGIGPNGPVSVRFAKRAEKKAKTLVTQKTMARKNWWLHPMGFGAREETGVDKSGKTTTYWIPDAIWLTHTVTPEDLREQARFAHDAIRQAQLAGRLRVEDDDE